MFKEILILLIISSYIFTRCSEIAIFSSAIVGSGLGFLWYNSYPAQIFMGDIGSLSLGAILATLAVLLRLEIVYAIMEESLL